MTFAEVELAVLPPAATKGHGPHLPLLVDAATSTQVSVQAARQLYRRVLVASFTCSQAIDPSAWPRVNDGCSSPVTPTSSRPPLILQICPGHTRHGRIQGIEDKHGLHGPVRTCLPGTSSW